MKLTTRYLGLELEHPFMPGASPLADTLESVRQLEDAGASAIVMRSLFEEQILSERFGSSGFPFGPDTYLEQLRRIKACVSVPVIASLNGTNTEGWLKYARLLQRAGADAIELNFYHLATDPSQEAASVEARLLDIVAVLKESITIPLAVKLSPFYSSLPNLAARLDSIGAQGLVLFNRFYQADIEPGELESVPLLHLSTSDELLLRLRWLAIVSRSYRGSLAITGGVHQPIDAVKAILAGADAVQMVSAILKNGAHHLAVVREGFERWCEEHEYESIDQVRDGMSLAHESHPRAAERKSYLQVLQSWKRAMTIFLVIMSTTGTVAGAQSLQPDGWDAGLKLVEAADLNPDPKIVEVTLDARISSLEITPGVRTDAWTYNGGLPGPLIRARRGDRIIVHFSNRLPHPTTVHWHGVQVPIQMDGVPGASQAPVAMGESFKYDFVVPDAGLFWYHPHVMSAAQVGFGLYGPLLVEDPEDTVKVEDQLVLVLSDIALDDDGKMHAADSGGVLGALLGREGNHVLVNGRVRPKMTVRDGALQRWRIVNAAKSRYFELVLGDGQPFELIGVDGGHMEYSLQRYTIVLGPGERADVLVAPKLDGKVLTLITTPFNRGFGSTEFRSADELIVFAPAKLPVVAAVTLPKVTRDIPPASAKGATPVTIDLVMTKEHGVAGFALEGGPFWRKTSVRADVGETQLWTITNKAIWAHPIHLHGFFFQEVDEKGVPLRPRAWKDTIHVPVDATKRFLVKLDRPGSWMFHCHILDHAEAGLMSTIDVGDIDTPHGEHAH